jgi:peptidoglycan/LPS O-acetylase OafA/YrhL
MKLAKHLDGLRGWAAMSVMLHHMSYHLFFLIGGIPEMVVKCVEFITVWEGNLSVTIFFVLSGRVLAYSFLSTKEPLKIVESMIKRPFRLIIPCFISLVVHWILQVTNSYSSMETALEVVKAPNKWWEYKVGHKIEFSQIFSKTLQLFLAPYQLPPSPIMHVYWTLPIEFVNSYIVYIVALIGSYLKKKKWILYSSILFISWINCLNNSWTAPFISGLIIAEMAQDGIFKSIEDTPKENYVKYGLLITIVACILCQVVRNEKEQSFVLLYLSNFVLANKNLHYPRFNQLNLLYLILASCLICLFELSPLYRKIFNAKILQFFGKISFGVYLLHPLIIPSIGSAIAVLLFNPTTQINTNFASITTKISIVVITIACSYVFYYIADRPSIKAGKKVYLFFRDDFEDFSSISDTHSLDNKIFD